MFMDKSWMLLCDIEYEVSLATITGCVELETTFLSPEIRLRHASVFKHQKLTHLIPTLYFSS